MTREKKLQHLLITHLKEKGTIQLILPDGIMLNIGITQEDENGEPIINEDDDYCWVVTKRADKAVLLDSYNLGLSFIDDPRTIVFEDVNINQQGDKIKSLDVV